MGRTLQDQYLLIKEGKGHKDVFMKEAKNQFPGLIRNAATFNEVANVLKDKSIIKENITETFTPTSTPGTKKESFETAFENFLNEAKDTYFEDEKAEVKKTSKQVEDTLSHNFDRADQSNPDNLIFDQIMKGYYTEMKDPKNADKTMEQLKAIVFKNLEKNPIYYTEKGQFGVKDLGYTTEAPGLGEPKEPKGPHKSSGYGNLNEGKINESYVDEIRSNNMSKEEAYDFLEFERGITGTEADAIVVQALSTPTTNLRPGQDPTPLAAKVRKDLGRGFIKESLEEQKIRKVIRESIEKELAAINKEAELEVLDSKLEKIEAAIEKRNAQLSKLDEDEDMKALTDKKKIKDLQKDIKTLEKAKSKIEKQLEKANKKNKGANVSKKEVIDEEEVLNEVDPKGTEAARDASKEMVDNFKELEATAKKIELEEDENGIPQSIVNIVVDEYAKTGGDDSKIGIIAASFPNYEEEIIEYLEGYDLGLDYDI